MTPRLMSAIVATVGALVFAGVATAHSDHQGSKGAKVYRATFATGKAQLVDGKKRNKISIHVRGLTPGATYTWHIHKAANATDDPCAPPAPVVDGTPYGDWVYGALTANAAGNASAKAKSATFDSRADPGPFYVDVHQADGTMVACGVLVAKAKKPHAKNSHANKDLQPRHDTEGKGHGHGPSQGQDD
jgi:hypothetical protein